LSGPWRCKGKVNVGESQKSGRDKGTFFVLISEEMHFGLRIKWLQGGMCFVLLSNLNYLKSQLPKMENRKKLA